MDQARLPFSMNATVSYGTSPPEPLPDQLPPGWVRIPVSFQVMLPAEVMEGARQGGASSAGSGHGSGTPVSIVPHSLRLGAGTHPDDGRIWQDFDALLQDLQDEPLPPGTAQASRHDTRPISAGALNSLGIHAAFGQQSGTRPINPVSFSSFKVPSAPTPPDAGNPSGAADGGSQPVAGTGQTSGTTGNRALDVAFNAGRTATLHRVPPVSAATARLVDARDEQPSLQPEVHPSGRRPDHVASKPAHTESLEDRNVRELASVIWTEARGVGDDAMIAVGWTLRNRMIRNEVDQVDKAWHGYTHGTQPRGANSAHAEDIARSILDGKRPDPTGGATHFYTPQAMRKDGDPEVRGMDISGGLEDVPGVTENGKPVRNYRPGWATSFTQESVENVPEASFKFYRPVEDGPTH